MKNEKPATKQKSVKKFDFRTIKSFEDACKQLKKRGSGKCLHLQISINNEKHIVFTGSSGLIEVIEQVPATGFPFTTTINEENERYLFT